MNELTIKEYFKVLYRRWQLFVAVTYSDIMFIKNNVQYFVLPDELDKLLVLSEVDIYKLKQITELKEFSVMRKKRYSRVGKNKKKKKFIRIKVIGRKVFGMSRMKLNASTKDLIKECFYHTPKRNGTGKITDRLKNWKCIEWLDYKKQMTERKLNHKKLNHKN